MNTHMEMNGCCDDRDGDQGEKTGKLGVINT